MSEDFLNMIMKSKTSSIDEKIKKLSMVLDKVMNISIKSINGIKQQIQYFESMISGIENQVNNLESKINDIESKPLPEITSTDTSQMEVKPQTASRSVPDERPISPPEPRAAPKPKIASKPKPVSANINPRAALQSELKQLFSKMKQK
ncbi:MAG: hypothetical protein GF329_13025 [Candidatus Lokiarchaeota archaeon]|nr:hypothetical protein [Candidatus Lokiarchaeota archaeon]